MAELKTPNGLIVGLIPEKPTLIEEKPEPVEEKPTTEVAAPHRGRKKSN